MPDSNYKESTLRPEKRVLEFVSGFKSVFSCKFDDLDYILTDQTVGYLEEIDNRITKLFPEYLNTFFTKNNKYGCINKGAGLIEVWINNLELIKKYEWFLHFEPRLELKSFDFVESFLKKPRNLFTLGSGSNHFNTGLFGIHVDYLVKYCETTNLDSMVSNNISIEYSIYDFLNSNKIPYFIENKMGVIWKDTFTGLEHHQ